MAQTTARDGRIKAIRSWRDHVVGVYGVPHQRGDSDLVNNNKAWWSDVDALLDALDESAAIVAAARAWGAARDGYDIVKRAEGWAFANRSPSADLLIERADALKAAIDGSAALGTEGDANFDPSDLRYQPDYENRLHHATRTTVGCSCSFCVAAETR